MNHFLKIAIGLVFATNAFSVSETSYTIEKSMHDEIFIINHRKFEAKSFCFNMDAGDEVIFLEGSPDGSCVLAKIYNKRTRKSCDVWCE